jgi:hypothetical protein
MQASLKLLRDQKGSASCIQPVFVIFAAWLFYENLGFGLSDDFKKLTFHFQIFGRRSAP